MNQRNEDPFANVVDIKTHHGGGGGGGGGMFESERLTRLEVNDAIREKSISDISSEIRGIRHEMSGFERRLGDKIEENQKWLVGLIVSSIIVPLLIALITK
ncbi:hypothetical protein [Cronobacter universalis]|nr:hypothetical protein [Cronobacter universalis]